MRDSVQVFGAVIAALLLWAADANAQQRQKFLLIDRDLRADIVELVSVEDGWVECLRSGLTDRRPMSDLLVLVRADEEQESSRFAAGDRVVELADGQRWVGAPWPASRPERLDWKIDRVGGLSAPLEQVLRARLQTGAPLPELDSQGAEERLVLANGDVLAGLLVSVGEEVEFEVSGTSEVTRLPIEQVASLGLVNSPAPPSGMMIWLADGSVLRVTECRWSTTTFKFTTVTGSLECSVETSMLRGINFAAERIMALAGLEPRVSLDSKWLQVVEAPQVVDPHRAVGLSDVQLRGPVEVRYELPQGATRFASTATVPRFAAQWADLLLTVLVDDEVVLQEAMDGTGRSRREIDVPLRDASTLTIRIGEGGRGPVQDVILLQRPMLLLE